MNPLPSSDRNQPRIHDHETLRLIGRGAYGEVWLARSVTGVLRAVKVVWRVDYDYPEAFEREFEAIKKFEPVSRRHPGLVSILQVGRNDEEGFYYYVMELADDVDNGRNIVAETYRPLTLMALMRKEGRLKAADCLKHGETIADALHFMHENGLIHRDVKPSNLIFSDGECRLVDIGLVALLGQRSFVGTEGFVAPEGPGTAEADIFSLGMVLYEASTGKDRLDFPDLPSAHESGDKIEQWRLLHRVICRACAQHAQDRFLTAHDMALALRGEKVPTRGSRRKLLILAGALGLLFTGVLVGLSQQEKITAALHHTEPLLTIVSDPAGAQVYSNGELLGTTPLNFNPREGVPAIYRVHMTGYRNQEIEYTANKKKPARYELKLEQSKLPQPGERWSNSIKLPFVPKQGGHVSERPVQMKFFDTFIKAEARPFEGRVVRYQVRGDKESAYIVVVPPADAEAFRHWMTEKDRERGFLTSEHRYELEPFSYADAEAVPPPDAADSSREWQAFSLRVERQGYGSVMVRSNPSGVKVFQRGELLGITPLEIPRIKTGEVEYDLRADGFTDLILEGTVAENAMLELFADMQARRNVTYGREWRNSLGMVFLPLGDILMGAHETRRRDYMEYAKEANARRPMNFSEQGKAGAVPVVGVDRAEARGFCEWMTKRDRDLGLIGKTDRYRLPTDEEWSRAVGLPLERGKDPAERNGRIRGVYPWGYEWPPPKGIDNFADASGSVSQGLQAIITSYEDNFSALAGVMAMRPGKKGYYALAGNISEWVDTDYVATNGKASDKSSVMGTVRGGNWRSANADELLSSARLAVPVDTKRDSIGFRIVLAKE